MSENPISLEAEKAKAEMLLRQPSLPQPRKIDQSKTEPRPIRLTPLIIEVADALAQKPFSDISLDQLRQFTYLPTPEDPNPIRSKITTTIARDLSSKVHLTFATEDIYQRAILAGVIEIAQNGLKTVGAFPELTQQFGYWFLKSLMWRQEEIYARFDPEFKLENIIDLSRERYIQGLSILIPFLDDDLARQLVVIIDVLRAPHEVMFPALGVETLQARIKLTSVRQKLLVLAVEHYQLLRLTELPLSLEDPPELPIIIQENFFQ